MYAGVHHREWKDGTDKRLLQSLLDKDGNSG